MAGWLPSVDDQLWLLTLVILHRTFLVVFLDTWLAQIENYIGEFPARVRHKKKERQQPIVSQSSGYERTQQNVNLQ